MTKRILILLISIILGGQALAQRNITLDDIFASEQFFGKTVADVQWLPDGKAFTFTRINNETGEVDIYRHTVKSSKEMLVLDGAGLSVNGQKVEMSAYQTTGQQNMLLITGKQRQIWRHSYAAPYFLYDITAKTLIPLAKGDADLQNVMLSPDGKYVAYAKANNLYVAEISTGESKQLTFDGSDNILNGVFDWVYEEEFGRPDAYRWSPDGLKIAFWRTDQTRVKTFYMLDEMPHYAKLTELKYPKVGEQNAIVEINVVTVGSGDVQKMDIGENDDIYIPRMDWTNTKDVLAIQRLNRKQNHLELLFANANTGETKNVMSDNNNTWVDVTDDYVFLKKKDQFVYTSEKDGFRHIYLMDYSGKELGQLTSGNWEVGSILGVDERGGWVYFYGNKLSPAHHDIYRVKLNGKSFQRVSTHLDGWHTANFSPDYRHYVSFSSNVKTPTVVSLRKSDGKEVRVLEQNDIPALANFDLVYPEYFNIKTSDNDTELNCMMMKPANFDPTKKYPVIVFGYGGPGSQMVINRWGLGSRSYHVQRFLWHNYMLQQGYIVFTVDNRGTGGRGKAFKDLAYGDLSKYSVGDQIEGAKYLASLPYVEPNRIGFWGWSGGGYLTMMMMTRASDYFSTGVAVASVNNFRNYDTIWTERYMGLLTENADGYEAANADNYVSGLDGKLMIIHGSGDDNVHPQNTLQFADKLIDANKQFDLMIYPNRNHRISGGNTYRHLFTLITNYFLTHL